MRFYRKDQLLLMFNVLLSLAKLCTGFLYYIEDLNWFLFIAFFSRFVTGIAQGCIIPIIYSYIPELFPENMMVKFGVIEILGSIGVILGGLFGTFINDNYGYLAVFAIFAAINLIFGTAIILFNLKSDLIERLSEGKIAHFSQSGTRSIRCWLSCHPINDCNWFRRDFRQGLFKGFANPVKIFT